MIPPVQVQQNAKIGLKLFREHCGGRKLGLPEKLANGEALSSEEILEVDNFFENFQRDRGKSAWRSEELPSADWIQWMLMGGDEGSHWAEIARELRNSLLI
ncbi:hypothetical protein CKA32_001339 [Geitlerinema sp. FC II]|nr:hypothetical protein CKA32_001339 [Geitlerinema sp. FC II]